jgi:glycosyltransferase involved in cell wall biosynthesis
MLVKEKNTSITWPNLENISWFKKNQNVVSIWKWLFIKNENLPFVTFTFMSRKYSSNVRCMNLNYHSKQIRIVLFKGTRVAKFDYFIIKSINIIIKLFSQKITKSYKGIFLYGIPNSPKLRINQFLHLDDPKYNKDEFMKLIQWESRARLLGVATKIIVTSIDTTNILKKNNIRSEIIEITQGFSEVWAESRPMNRDFKCVYASAYVAYGRDKNSKDTTWGADFLIEKLLPMAQQLPEEITICIVGNIGSNAKKELSKFKNVKIFSYMSQIEMTKFLQTCNVGLYPRTFDHKRRILKVYSYLSAELPTVTFDLVDTADIKDYKLGLVVHSASEFIAAILSLYEDDALYKDLAANISRFKIGKDWATLSKKLEMSIS